MFQCTEYFKRMPLKNNDNGDENYEVLMVYEYDKGTNTWVQKKKGVSEGLVAPLLLSHVDACLINSCTCTLLN